MPKMPIYKTKIVCTIGPASSSSAMLKRLVRAGMNVARLNLSHGTLDEHSANIERIRSVAKELDLPLTILLDLPGPKIRVGMLQREPLWLKKGAHLTLTSRSAPGSASVIPVEYEDLPRAVTAGSTIFLNDGFIELRVLETSPGEVKCRVMVGGELLSRKGITIPEAAIYPQAVTEHDLDLVAFGLERGVELFGISFVESGEDVDKLKEFSRKRGNTALVVAKIERAEAVRNIDGILNAADGIMIARGDLGVHIPIENVPVVQKQLIHKANLLGKPVITATQMLLSMTENIRPTRAEVTDVANAILDGTDAVMLSEETALGKHPVEAVRTMARIAARTEKERETLHPTIDLEQHFARNVRGRKVAVEDIISVNVIQTLRALNARLVLVPTRTGSTPRRVSRFKPGRWVIAFCDSERISRFMALVYGVYPVLVKEPSADWNDLMMDFVHRNSLANDGDRLIITQGTAAQYDSSDSLRVVTVQW
ncbi:MAG: pyruvate kinase [Dehalococcoidia bacterium]